MVAAVVTRSHFVLKVQMFKDRQPLKTRTSIDCDEKEKLRQRLTNIMQAMQDEEMIELRNQPIDFDINQLRLHTLTLVPLLVLLFVPISKQPSVFIPFIVQFVEYIFAGYNNQ